MTVASKPEAHPECCPPSSTELCPQHPSHCWWWMTYLGGEFCQYGFLPFSLQRLLDNCACLLGQLRSGFFSFTQDLDLVFPLWIKECSSLFPMPTEQKLSLTVLIALLLRVECEVVAQPCMWGHAPVSLFTSSLLAQSPTNSNWDLLNAKHCAEFLNHSPYSWGWFLRIMQLGK